MTGHSSKIRVALFEPTAFLAGAKLALARHPDIEVHLVSLGSDDRYAPDVILYDATAIDADRVLAALGDLRGARLVGLHAGRASAVTWSGRKDMVGTIADLAQVILDGHVS